MKRLWLLMAGCMVATGCSSDRGEQNATDAVSGFPLPQADSGSADESADDDTGGWGGSIDDILDTTGSIDADYDVGSWAPETVDSTTDSSAVQTEDCNNGVDDDANGLVDCADFVCKTEPACIEQCDDGVDNDKNGLIDCADFACQAQSPCTEQCDDGVDNDKNGLIDCQDPACEDACQVETCNDWYVCLIEQGCDCDVDVNCPEDQGQCLQVCAQNDNCNGFCTSELSLQFAQYLGDWLTCLDEKCANTTGDAFIECYITNCAEEFAYCFYGGTEACSYFYFDCAPQCQTNACVSDCVAALSPQGFLDANEWDICRGDLCDANEDDQNDSDACYFLGSFFACIDSANGCVPADVLGGEGTCADAAACVAACDSLGDGDCVTACLQFVGAENVTAVSDLFQCTIATCGTTEAELVPACLDAAWKNACATEAAACGISEGIP